MKKACYIDGRILYGVSTRYDTFRCDWYELDHSPVRRGRHESGKYKLTAVYSRSLEQAQHFANDFSVEHLFTSLEAMAESDAIDAVYIASPNSCTFPRHNFSLAIKFM